MPTSPLRRTLTAGLVLAAASAAAPAAASAAASVTVTNDAGAAVPVAAGAPPTIRNMRPSVTVGFPPGDARGKVTILNPQGAVAAQGICRSNSTPSTNDPSYTGNGTYTISVANYGANDNACATPTSTETYTFNIAASTAITPPTAAFLLRPFGSFTTNRVPLQVQGNPGGTTVVAYLLNGQIGPDGAIVGAPSTASIDAATGVASFLPQAPGTYTVVSRATRFSAGGEFGSPWSPPVKVTVLAPFDAPNSLEFTDNRGPSYRIRLALREKSARGRVSIALAKGSKGGKYRSLGSSRLSSGATATKRFRAGLGTYRLRFKFKGSSTVAGGFIVYKLRFTRRPFFG